MSVDISLSGKTALVAGGARGIGKAVALLYAAAGANVMIADIDLSNAKNVATEIEKDYGVTAEFCQCNVGNKTHIDLMVHKTIKTFKKIDIFAYIAGFSTKVDFEEISEDVYDQIMKINAKGAFLANQAVLKTMIPYRSGKIINMSSMSGKEGFDTNVAYTAAKFAVTGMTQAIAKYAANYNINVNCVCPGIVKTAIWEKILADHKAHGGDPKIYWEKRIKAIPLKRPQTAEDVAAMFLYLASSLSDNITGQAINISGGLIMH